MSNDRLRNLRARLRVLGDRWKPDGGKVSVKKIWDANRKQFNLPFFANYSYVAILGNEEAFTYLLGLENDEEKEAFIEYNRIGKSPWQVVRLDDGQVVYFYVPPNKYGYRI